jgi:hypothetical protein
MLVKALAHVYGARYSTFLMTTRGVLARGKMTEKGKLTTV